MRALSVWIVRVFGKIQSIRLKKIVDYVYHNTPFYRKKMQEMGSHSR